MYASDAATDPLQMSLSLSCAIIAGEDECETFKKACGVLDARGIEYDFIHSDEIESAPKDTEYPQIWYKGELIGGYQSLLDNVDSWCGMDLYQDYIVRSRYSRFVGDRKETWQEVVDRYINFFSEHLKQNHGYDDEDEIQYIRSVISQQKVMPSMRCLLTSGPALKKSNIGAYNCSALAMDEIASFPEVMYLLMHGTGVGFSCEKRFVEKLPVVPDALVETESTYQVMDSKEGWYDALHHLVTSLYDGCVPSFDASLVRKKGTALKTFGGYASGPEPLLDLFEFTVGIFKSATGRQLTPLNVHDIVCKIADITVCGGVRRSALISLSDLSDEDMRTCKSGSWWEKNNQRGLANNSAVYTKADYDKEEFWNEWTSLKESGSGERGIFNRYACERLVERHGRDACDTWLTNPCAEIILRPNEFCNLSEAVVRPGDDESTLMEKIRVASILGTWQSTLTHLPKLRKEWVRNCEVERLLGVSMTGIMDNALLNGTGDESELRALLNRLRDMAIETNKTYAGKLGIPASASVTAIKPSGTSSALNGTASGCHPRHSKYYIRRVRGGHEDPVTKLFIREGVTHEQCAYSKENVVFSFPFKSPDNALLRKDLTALDHLRLYQIYQDEYTTHKPSITVSVREDEWDSVGTYVYDNLKNFAGVSFLPYSDHSYVQAPFEECDEQTYLDLLKQTPTSVDWNSTGYFKRKKGELACTGGACELNTDI